ncbi:hypothetical protein SAMN05421503_1482 [Terribacillus aidingensis]|uniref:Uncharacterized protein n=1 Tax=Terribacillus aidingensis TaxID=586416 RepID=A0A285NM37_9BACI|nr:hypothetical protein [Terribacillus aidingensis]SNZ10027.1 hypothetical protein SAMN05421503_1482 [Terribacillus aidingensis]
MRDSISKDQAVLQLDEIKRQLADLQNYIENYFPRSLSTEWRVIDTLMEDIDRNIKDLESNIYWI